MPSEDTITKPLFKFSGNIVTDHTGNQQLVNFYNFCCNYSSCWITIDVNGLIFFDANLSALLMAMIHKLRKERGLNFFLDWGCLKGELNILIRNGLAFYISKSQKVADDFRQSTVPVKAFLLDNADSFTSYIEKDFLNHRGLDGVKIHDKEKIKNCYFEIFDNVGIHANTSYPVIACGQYFPYQKELKFTLVDLGEGFLKKIAAFTKDKENIITSVDAINWAVKGGSTKDKAEGGTGLKKILFYCIKNGGSIHIVTGNSYWKYDKRIDDFKILNAFVGSSVHLIFRYL